MRQLLMTLLGAVSTVAAQTVTVSANTTNSASASTAPSSCNANGTVISAYNLGLHVAAIFVVLIGSCIGVSLPIVFKGRTGRLGKEIFFVAKYLGSGVIIATAYVHVLFESFQQLSHTCLRLIYAPTAPAVAMASTLCVLFVDIYLQRLLRRSQRSAASEAGLSWEEWQIGQLRMVDPQTSTSSSMTEADEKHFARRAELVERQKYFDVLVIEGGIIFHSVMVGLGLGVSGDQGFVPYFIAIVFHQWCDGLALGTRIALLDLSNKRMKLFIMIAAYSFVTPVGIALGVGVRQAFNAQDPSTILAIGVLDSISAGVLLYGALVDIIAKDFLMGAIVDASNKRITAALVSLLAGCGIMSLLGQWA